MKRLLTFLLLSCIAASAQGVCLWPSPAVANTGAISNNVLEAIPGAQVWVCGANSGGTPCSPLLPIYSSPTLGALTQIVNPITADVNGNYFFCVAPQPLLIQVGGTGLTTFSQNNYFTPSDPINPIFTNLSVTGFEDFTEIAAPAVSAAGHDRCYGDSSTHVVKCSLNTGAYDLLVGEARAETLSNKTLTGAGSGNSVSLLNQQATVAALTGNSSDQVLYTYTLPANTLGAGKCLRILAIKLHTQGTASTTYKLNFGGTVWRSDAYAVQAANTQNERLAYYVCNNVGVQNAQNGYDEYWLYNASAPASGTINQIIAPLTAAINFANSQVISLTFNVANTDKEAGQFFMIELVQ